MSALAVRCTRRPHPRARLEWEILCLMMALVAGGLCFGCSGLSASQGAPQRHPDASSLFHADFGDGFDRNYDGWPDHNYDGWPDHWKRRRSPEYPAYVKIALSKEASPASEGSLKVALNGGAAAILSPPIPVTNRFRYVVEGYIKTEQLTHDVAYISLTFQDVNQRPVATVKSEPIGKSTPWKQVRFEAIAPEDDTVRSAVIGLHVDSTAEMDLQGAVLFDDIWLGRLPQISLETGQRYNVYADPQDLEVTCTVSGVPERELQVVYQLLDVEGRELERATVPLNGRSDLASHPPHADGAGGSDASAASHHISPARETDTAVYFGRATWRPHVPGHGFYTVRAVVPGRGGADHRRELSLVVIRSDGQPRGNEFGWSLPQGEKPLDLNALVGLLRQTGISWVKFPVWFSADDTRQADALSAFAERLGLDGIEMVGMLDQPPPAQRELFGGSGDLPAAGVFADVGLWQPALNPVMTRLSLKIRWWQLGRDDDDSFINYPELIAKIDEVKRQLDRFGLVVNVGLPWRWLHGVPVADKVPWAYLSLREEPPLTADEQTEFLAQADTGTAQRWVVIHPLARSQYSLTTRTHDLVTRMLAAKIGGAQGIFASNPFDAEHGLMRPEGTPGELFLPWRTTALMISGTERLGSLQLPLGSPNQVLVRQDRATMVVWNEEPTTEEVFLGANVRQVDLWGREQPLKVADGKQVIAVGPLPIFLTDVDPAIARWCMSLQFEQQQLANVFGRPQVLSLRVRNPFSQGITGELALMTPDSWGPRPVPFSFKMSVNEERVFTFPITLRSDVSSGQYDVRIDCQISGDQDYHFDVLRTLEIGGGNLFLELSARIDDQGQLVVEQQMVNQSDEVVNFSCYLHIPERRRLRKQVYDLGRGRDKKTYVIPNGAELVGKKIWLRAEEIGGDRIRNYRLVVER